MTDRTLWLKSWKVQVDDIEISETSLDIAFEVERSIHATANKCTLTLYNLNPDNRGALTRLRSAHRRIRVQIWAGYKSLGAPPLIFRGDLRSYKEKKDGPDYVSTIEGNDGGRSFLASRFSRSYPPGTRIDTVLRDLAESMGLGPGNSSELAGAGFSTRNTFPDGVVVHGSAATELTRLLRGAGFSYSVQNDAIQVLRHGHAVQDTALEMNSDTGLLNAEPGDHHTVAVTSLLVPDLYPGRYLHVQGATVQGYYRANTVKYSGDTSPGGDWNIDATCRVLHTSIP